MTSLIERAYAVDANNLGNAIQVNESATNIGDLVDLVIKWVLYIAGVLAFVYLVVSGITYITAGGNAEQAKKGQQGIINSIIGIVIIVLAFVILQAVNSIANNR